MSEVKFEPFQKVLVRDSNQDRWLPDIFRIFDDCNTHPYYCMHNNYMQCIPYNDETKHLLGTTDSPTPPELEFTFGDKVEVSDDGDNWIKAVYVLKNFANSHNAFSRETGLSSYTFCRRVEW